MNDWNDPGPWFFPVFWTIIAIGFVLVILDLTDIITL